MRSSFIHCYFENCTLSSSFFNKTKWGDPQNKWSYNVVKNCVYNGEISFIDSKGIGPALFMPKEACKISLRNVLDKDYTLWKAEQLQEAIKALGWGG